MKKTLFYLISALFLVFCGCDGNDGSCRKDLNVQMGASNFQMVFDTELGTFKQQNYSPKLTISGLGIDSLLYKEQTLGNFNLPLKKTETTSKFVLKTELGTDTLTIEHTNHEELESLECGCKITHTITSATTTTHVIDSVSIKFPNVTKVGEQNLNIFYHVK